MAKKARRATRRARRTSKSAKLAKAQLMLDMAAASAAEHHRRFEQSCAEARAAAERATGAEQARAADALAVLTAMLKQVPPGADGMISCGFSVAQARALVAVLGRVV